MISIILQLVFKQLSPTCLRVITVLGIRAWIYTKVYMLFLVCLVVSQTTRIKKMMEFLCLDIEEQNKQQAWLIIGNKTTRMLHMFNVWHNQRNMRKGKNPSDLLPSKIAMNIQWIPLLYKNMVSSIRLYFGYNSYACSFLRYAQSVQALCFSFCICFTVVTIQALDSLLLCWTSFFLKVIYSGFATIFDTQPYACIAIVLLLAFLWLLLLNLILI